MARDRTSLQVTRCARCCDLLGLKRANNVSVRCVVASGGRRGWGVGLCRRSELCGLSLVHFKARACSVRGAAIRVLVESG